MKTKLIFSTQKSESEQWTNLPFIPHKDDWFNLQDILKTTEIEALKKSATSWAGVKGLVESVEYRHDENEFYAEIVICCKN
jgi:hypothetical protein